MLLSVRAALCACVRVCRLVCAYISVCTDVLSVHVRVFVCCHVSVRAIMCVCGCMHVFRRAYTCVCARVHVACVRVIMSVWFVRY